MPRRIKALLLSTVAAWALLLSPILYRVAVAETGNPDIDAAIALYEDLEYEQAAAALEIALAKQGLSKQEATEGYRYLALSYLALGDEAKARDAFGRLLDVDPRYELPRTENPRAIDLFDEVKAARPPPPAVTLTSSPSPERPKPGSAITFAIALDGDVAKAVHVHVYHRTRGQKSYSVVSAELIEGQWTATISGAFVAAPAIEYYVVAEGGKTDGVIGSEGSADTPLVLIVAGSGGAAPIYAKWWFWAGVGGVLVAGAAAALILGADGGTAPNDFVDVTITVGTGP